MSRLGLVIITVIVLIGLAFVFTRDTQAPTSTDIPVPTTETEIPSDEAAELTAFGFMQDFLQTAPPDPDAEASERAYNVLSSSAKARVSMDTISRDLAAFVGVQDVPDQGVSVEDLQMNGNEAALIVGLNYSGSGRLLKQINMVIENGQWKVDSIEPADEY